MKNENHETLFLMMSMKDDDIELAENAFCEFHRRFANYLYAVIRNACSGFIPVYGDTFVESVFSNTMLTIYEKAGEFTSVESLDEDHKVKRIKSWLGKIARNETFQLLREYREGQERIDYNTDFINESNIIDEPEENEVKTIEKKLLDIALNSLKEKERDILLTFFRYEEAGKNTPTNVLQELCTYYDTTSENLRQIKSRALKKINEHIKEHQKEYNYQP